MEMKGGRHLKVNVSVPNLRLFVGNIPKSKGKAEIMEEFSKVTGKRRNLIPPTTVCLFIFFYGIPAGFVFGHKTRTSTNQQHNQSNFFNLLLPIFEMKEKNPEFRNRFQFFIGGEWWLVFFFW
jgi:hypothetical protein